MNEDVNTALALLNIALGWIARLKANHALAAEDLLAAADASDLANKEQIKALLAMG